MMNLDLIFPEIFLSLSIMTLLMIGVFKKKSENLVYNLSIITLAILFTMVVNLFAINDQFIFNYSYKIDNLSSFMKALTILSGIEPGQLKDKVINGDVAALTSVPGVGSKTAKRIIIELKEKFIKSDDDSSLGFNEEKNPNTPLYNDVVNALVSLGYKQNYAKKACSELDKKGEMDGEIEVVIKKALKILMS